MEVYPNGAALVKARAITNQEAETTTTVKVTGFNTVITMEKAGAIANKKVTKLKAHGSDHVGIHSDSNRASIERAEAIPTQKEAGTTDTKKVSTNKAAIWKISTKEAVVLRFVCSNFH